MLDPALVFKKFEINKSCIINLHMMQKKFLQKGSHVNVLIRPSKRWEALKKSTTLN